ncbi:hypothetical protein BDV95DRAFT_328575 [Massariosphaeria phaeospora]|uniref:Uncharacterized protein n=1 Tax=Massariosphaeria phaeospora TaxID=100035 RepID=A0A7C8MFS7_9PLEO|nr:hypothetical protein BDV95DRAFT_328575 [Massariosphaeria phaeospora]
MPFMELFSYLTLILTSISRFASLGSSTHSLTHSLMLAVKGKVLLWISSSRDCFPRPLQHSSPCSRSLFPSQADAGLALVHDIGRHQQYPSYMHLLSPSEPLHPLHHLISFAALSLFTKHVLSRSSTFKQASQSNDGGPPRLQCRRVAEHNRTARSKYTSPSVDTTLPIPPPVFTHQPALTTHGRRLRPRVSSAHHRSPNAQIRKRNQRDKTLPRTARGSRCAQTTAAARCRHHRSSKARPQLLRVLPPEGAPRRLRTHPRPPVANPARQQVHHPASSLLSPRPTAPCPPAPAPRRPR